jgi:hypothetical protein
MKQFRINEQEKSRILGLHIEATSRQYLKEDLNNGMTTIERYNYNRGIQCFLNKKNVKDDEGKSLKMDGSIGNLPNSKSAQAIAKYQSSIGVDNDGVWGYETNTKMTPKDKMIYKQCISDHGDIIDKGMHLLGID